MHARNTPPLRIPLQEIWKWATETLNLLLTTSLRKKAHKVWRHHLLSETLQDGALPCLSAGWDHGEGSMAFQEYQPDRTTPVRKNTLSNRKHLLRQCLIITQMTILIFSVMPQDARGSDEPVCGTWEAKSKTSQNICLLTYEVHRMSGTGVLNK